MSSFDEELLQDAEDDARTIAYIKEHLPNELQGQFTDEQLYYFLDTIMDYYSTSGLLDAEPDKDDYINVDIEAVAQYVQERAQMEGMGTFSIEDLENIIETEMDYSESLE